LNNTTTQFPFIRFFKVWRPLCYTRRDASQIPQQ